MAETIAAIATPMGVGGIGVIRISGDEAVLVADRIFSGKKPLSEVKSHTIHYGYIKDGDTVIDSVMASVMLGPASFTGEDTVEISAHGSPVGLNKILGLIIKNGARLAKNGEFSRRSFENGKLDLAQAEAIIDIIHAESDVSLKSAVDRLEGSLSKKIDEIREPLLYCSAQFLAMVDYPDDEIADLTEDELLHILDTAIAKCKSLISKAGDSRLMREGILCVIAGRPNVGKSSLLNALTDSSRAIVTTMEGTTRDVIEQPLNLGGYLFRLADTAGIRAGQDEAEKIGVERSRSYIEASDMVLVLLDSSREITDEDKEVLALCKDKPHIIVLNKSDMTEVTAVEDIRKLEKSAKIILTSTKTEDGIEELKEEMKNTAGINRISPTSAIGINTRHTEALIRAKQALEAARSTLVSGVPIDLCAIDVEAAIGELGMIDGRTVQADVIDKIFAEFCVGK